VTKLCYIECNHAACVSADGGHFEHYDVNWVVVVVVLVVCGGGSSRLVLSIWRTNMRWQVALVMSVTVRNDISLFSRQFEEVSNTVTQVVTQLHFPGFCFSGTSLLGKQGQICFAEYLKIVKRFFAYTFCTDRVDIRLCSETNKKGGFSVKFGTFGPSKLVALAMSPPVTPTIVREYVFTFFENPKNVTFYVF